MYKDPGIYFSNTCHTSTEVNACTILEFKKKSITKSKVTSFNGHFLGLSASVDETFGGC